MGCATMLLPPILTVVYLIKAKPDKPDVGFGVYFISSVLLFWSYVQIPTGHAVVPKPILYSLGYGFLIATCIYGPGWILYKRYTALSAEKRRWGVWLYALYAAMLLLLFLTM